MKQVTTIRSGPLGRPVTVARWGEVGTPVLLFPTAGGDAEEIERFHLVAAAADLLAAGRVKIYSCDSVAGRAWLEGEGSPRHRSRIQSRFHHFVHAELVPAIRADCRSADIEIVAAGASIGAYNALAVLCRFPHAFRSALCMSGTYDLMRFLRDEVNPDFYFSSPLHFLPGLEGPLLDRLRRRFVVLASGEGAHEDLGESWRAAQALGAKGIPNRVDSWGKDWHHDWATWRAMLPRYLAELVPMT